ncbi:PIN-like domain-containing protein [Streptomyces sp. NPDC052299]|uniref:PIN-like domain-containing protein n=1 Tax=Streptomyces sp. NPDC052299 TaxID=3155054 RepID=UPI003415AC46
MGHDKLQGEQVGPVEPLLMQRFRSWLESAPSADDSDRAPFFTEGIVVLDTNILLSLYEYTESARAEVFTALESVSERLWMPHQVGLEFVRGRRSTLESRKAALAEAAKGVNQHLMQAVKSVLAARNVVTKQLAKYGAASEAIEELDALINDQAVKTLLQEYQAALKDHLDALKSQHGLPVDLTEANDPVLLRVARMYGDRIGAQPGDAVLRARIEEAVGFRFPNAIPPGYGDLGKETPMRAAGDFLVWEELVEHAKNLPHGSRRILFVSNDTKEDWYETSKGTGGTKRPSPMLFEELRARADAELRIETASLFFGGIKQFLHAKLKEATYEEIERVSSAQESHVPEEEDSLVTVDSAPHVSPPPGLATEASRSVGLATAGTRAALASKAPSSRVFQWWLIGVTAQLDRRTSSATEPRVDIAAACRGDKPRSGSWEPATVFRPEHWVYRDSSWIASWFVGLLKELPQSDHAILRSLAAQQAEANRSALE